MRIIIPMAGRGKRLRPHTLLTPKPLIPVAGKPIVQHLVEDLAEIAKGEIEEIAFITGRFGSEAEANLLAIAEQQGAKGRICYQDEALGTAHAIQCAQESLEGPVIVAFADTLFRADFDINPGDDAVIWVKEVDAPEQFGVVKLDADGRITELVEKPTTPVSNLAIIGIYYFKDGANLRNEIQYLLDNNIRDKGEYQLTSALANMNSKGKRLTSATVSDWLDCGNKNATVDTNNRVLDFKGGSEDLTKRGIKIEHSTIIQPCYIGDNVVITNSVVGPNTSIGSNSRVSHSVVGKSIVLDDTTIENKVLHNAMIGSNVSLCGLAEDLSLGDYSEVKA